MRLGIMATLAFAWETSSTAVPVVEWNTVDLTYNTYGTYISFQLLTFGRDGDPAYCWGNGERETDGWWTTLCQQNALAGIAFRFFEVSDGELVDFARSESANIVFGNDGATHDPYLFDFDQTVYLGFRLGWPEYNSAEYGWARLYFDGDTLSVTASATERTGLGIYAGTGTAIPEPTSMEFLLMGAAGILWKRNRTMRAGQRRSRHGPCAKFGRE